MKRREEGKERVIERIDRHHIQITCKGVETRKIVACLGNRKQQELKLVLVCRFLYYSRHKRAW